MSGEWLHWYYLVFLLPAAVAIVLLLLSGLGGHQGGHGHAHGGPGAHGHPGFGFRFHSHHGGAHGAHAGAHGAAHGHAAHGHAHHGTHGGVGREPNPAQQMLGFFGFGRAPLPVVFGSLMIGWGLFGILALEILRPILHLPVLFVGPAMLIAAVGALVCAKLFGELAARVMPKDESFAISTEGLLGLTGTVVYPTCETEGRVHVFDEFRTLHVKPARVAAGCPALPKGMEVIVASMDPERGTLIVEPLGFSKTSPQASRSAASTQPVNTEPVVEVQTPKETR